MQSRDGGEVHRLELPRASLSESPDAHPGGPGLRMWVAVREDKGPRPSCQSGLPQLSSPTPTVGGRITSPIDRQRGAGKASVYQVGGGWGEICLLPHTTLLQ